MRKIIFLVALAFSFLQVQATHIVGGEMYYTCIGGNDYRITLKVYRDCGPNNTMGTGFDNPLTIAFYNASNTLVAQRSVNYSSVVSIPTVSANPCLTPPPQCIEVATYETVINLPASPGGYTAVHQRCCRNASIQNLFDASAAGGTYFISIPDPGTVGCNSSPRFSSLPPLVICANNNFAFNHSATDPDGDSLVYSFYTPFEGGSSGAPVPSPPEPPPYIPLTWNPGYAVNNQIQGTPGLTINPATGWLSCMPNVIGIYVYAVRVREYRGGQLLSEALREFQINVVNCTIVLESIIESQSAAQLCGGLTLNFTNSSINATNYYWDFGDTTTLADTSLATNPSYTYPDTGRVYVTLVANPHTVCADTIVVPFDVHLPLDISFDKPNPQCVNSNLFNVEALGSFTPAANVSWDLPGSITPLVNGNPAQFSYPDSGKYAVNLTVSEFGCSETYTDSVEVFPLPVIGFTYPEELACEPYTIQFTDTTLSWAPVRYVWQFGDGQVSFDQHPQHTYTDTGYYSVTLSIEVDSVCVVTQTVTKDSIIHVYPTPEAGLLVNPNTESIFTPYIEVTDVATGHTHQVIYFGDGDSTYLHRITHQYADTGWYNIMQWVINDPGCTNTTVVPVYIIPETTIYVPNAFTPNGDGVNDVFLPVVRDVRSYRFTIFNRWGGVVFETTDPLQGWDGKRSGNLMKTDVYVYKIVYTNQQYIGAEKQGHFSLLK